MKDLRVKRGLTARALAKMLKKSPAYISKIENQGEIPSPHLICQLSEALSTPPASLLTCARRVLLERKTEDLTRKHKAALTLFRSAR